MSRGNTATLSIRVHSRACDNFGAVDYTITDTIVERDGGVHVTTVTRGTCEGARVDERHAKFWPEGSLDKAVSYRISIGYEMRG